MTFSDTCYDNMEYRRCGRSGQNGDKMQTIFSDTLTDVDIKRHIPHHVDVPTNCTQLTIQLNFEPAAIDNIRNMLTLTLFDPTGFRGAGHRGGNNHLVEIRPTSATPGYRPGLLPAGQWIVQIDTHMILPGEPCRYTLSVTAERGHVEMGNVELDEMPTTPSNPRFEAVANPNSGWYRGDLHAHTIHSDASWDVADLVAAAKAKELDFIALTDHNTVSPLAEMAGFTSDNFLTMGGQELTTFWGHAVCLGVHQWLDWRLTQDGDGMAAIANTLYANDQIYIVAHPKNVGDPYCTGCRWVYPGMMPGPARFVEVWNGAWIGGERSHNKNEEGLALWYQWLNQGHKLVATAGSDVHGPKGYASNPGFNTVYAEALSQQAILQGLAQGHLYLSSGPSLHFTAEEANGTQVMMGDTLAVDESTTEIVLQSRWDGAPTGASIRLIVDGKVHEEVQVDEAGLLDWVVAPQQAGWCLVELRAINGDMLALSNPIWIGGT